MPDKEINKKVDVNTHLLKTNHRIPIQELPVDGQSSQSIKAVAIYEIGKGIAALLAALALWRWHNELESWLSGINRLWHYYFGQLLMNQIESLMSTAKSATHHWLIFEGLILFYASLRFLEAYGLWTDKTWAYWFSVIGYGIFVPIELYYLVAEPFDWFKLAVFILNIIIIVVVYRHMKNKGLLG